MEDYNCRFCSKIFFDEEDLKDHIEVEHKNKTHQVNLAEEVGVESNLG